MFLLKNKSVPLFRTNLMRQVISCKTAKINPTFYAQITYYLLLGAEG